MHIGTVQCAGNTDVNRLLDNNEPLLPLLEDVTVVKYRRLKKAALKILCWSDFMLEAGGMFFRLPSFLNLRCCSHDIYVCKP